MEYQKIITPNHITMEYQKIITPNQLTKFRTKNWVEINDDSLGMYNPNSQIKFKTLMFRSSLCDFSDAYILVSGTVIVPSTAEASNLNNKKV